MGLLILRTINISKNIQSLKGIKLTLIQTCLLVILRQTALNCFLSRRDRIFIEQDNQIKNRKSRLGTEYKIILDRYVIFNYTILIVSLIATQKKV